MYRGPLSGLAKESSQGSLESFSPMKKTRPAFQLLEFNGPPTYLLQSAPAPRHGLPTSQPFRVFWSLDLSLNFMASRLRLYQLTLLSVVASLFEQAASQSESVFLSRPELQAPVLKVDVNDVAKVTQGYLFATPFRNHQPGPYVYDQSRNLIWSGFGVAGPANAHDFSVCDYKGSTGDHMSYLIVNQENGFGQGLGVIMDSHFRIVDTVKSSLGRGPADMHEFNVLPGGESAILIIYQPVQYDLSSYGIASTFGWVTAGIFQEIDIESGKVIFEWKSTNHVDPSESRVKPGTTDISGDGKSKATPYDYFHINSVDKSAEGEYLVSARHTSTIYKISPVDGSVIWRLGGLNSTLSLTGFNFSSQHDARFISETSSSTTLSFFDNGSNGYTITATGSTAFIIKVDNTTDTATVVSAYGSSLSTTSQGSTQVLPTGNTLVGYGSKPTVNEFTADGTLVYSASFSNTKFESYRWQKFNFTFQPTDQPALFSYAKTATSNTAFFASWNGDAATKSWTVWTGATNDPPSFTALATIDRAGFETLYTSTNGFAAYAFVEAKNADGKTLANSSTVMPFVPGPGLVDSCGDTQCVVT
ncbi:MAG: hypothetical protein M1814_000226 [Vezdaea aestivalis]|nr:MAG: hypothetical protein M1814_000226 [Vezdaea aestivalis]